MDHTPYWGVITPTPGWVSDWLHGPYGVSSVGVFDHIHDLPWFPGRCRVGVTTTTRLERCSRLPCLMVSASLPRKPSGGTGGDGGGDRRSGSLSCPRKEGRDAEERQLLVTFSRHFHSLGIFTRIRFSASVSRPAPFEV
jgi:hypothetical protein